MGKFKGMDIKLKAAAVVAAAALAAAPLFSCSFDGLPGGSAYKAEVDSGNFDCYFPRDGQEPQPALIDVISSAEKTVDMAIYSFTDTKIADALVSAEKKGVQVRVITDGEASQNKYQKKVLNKLKKAGIPVKVDSHSGLMHLKVTVADKKTATTGSFNYTKSAEEKNDEVFVVIKDSGIAENFSSEFEKMWDDADNFKKY
jgi:phosphatidylserine/phosphatidylglycerophosphate/cardiolipin synthase-like enzyme